LIRLRGLDRLLRGLFGHISLRQALPCQGEPTVRCTLTHGGR
jgi:hypothetical protein